MEKLDGTHDKGSLRPADSPERFCFSVPPPPAMHKEGGQADGLSLRYETSFDHRATDVTSIQTVSYEAAVGLASPWPHLRAS